MSRPRATPNLPSKLRLFNHYLTIVVAILGIYTLTSPFLPALNWWFKHDSPVHNLVHKPPKASQELTPPSLAKDVNELVIPSLEMGETVHEGDISALRYGVWHLPYTSTPAKGGNTVLVGHRFTYAGSAVFYHLDKVNKGDHLTLLWHSKTYEYEVFNIATVAPTEVSVEADTIEPRLTIYTCTPLWSAKDRLVIQAKLVKESL